MKFTIFSIISLISLVATAPIELEKRDVFVPPVLTPDSSSVWQCGSTQTVTWCVPSSRRMRIPDFYGFFFTYDMYDPFIFRDVSSPPKQITNTKGQIILVKNGMLDFGQF